MSYRGGGIQTTRLDPRPHPHHVQKNLQTSEVINSLDFPPSLCSSAVCPSPESHLILSFHLSFSRSFPGQEPPAHPPPARALVRRLQRLHLQVSWAPFAHRPGAFGTSEEPPAPPRRCLIKDFELRPNVLDLLQHGFIKASVGREKILQKQLIELIDLNQQIGAIEKTRYSGNTRFYRQTVLACATQVSTSA